MRRWCGHDFSFLVFRCFLHAGATPVLRPPARTLSDPALSDSQGTGVDRRAQGSLAFGPLRGSLGLPKAALLLVGCTGTWRHRFCRRVVFRDV